MSKKLIFLTAFVLVLALAAKTVATDYYVATDGDDDDDGSISSPFATVQKGFDTIDAGDTLYLRGGTYYEHVRIYDYRQGDENNWFKVTSYPGEWAIIDAQHSEAYATIRYYDGGHDQCPQYWLFESFEVTGGGIDNNTSSGGGIRLDTATDITFRYLYIHDNYGNHGGNNGGIVIPNDSGAAHGITIEWCHLKDNACTDAGNCANITLFGDYIENPASVDINTALRHNEICYNLIEGSSVGIKYKNGQILSLVDHSATHTTYDDYGDKVHHNIVRNPGTASIRARQDFIQVYNNIFASDSGTKVASVGENYNGDREPFYACFYNNTLIKMRFLIDHDNDYNPDFHPHFYCYNNIIEDAGSEYDGKNDLNILFTWIDWDENDIDMDTVHVENNYFWPRTRTEEIINVADNDCDYSANGYESAEYATTVYANETTGLHKTGSDYKCNGSHVLEGTTTIDDGGIGGSHPYLSGVTIPSYVGAADPNNDDWIDDVLDLVNLSSGAPGKATNPSPANSATGVSITADLSWTAGSGSTSSDVYFGTDSTPDSGEDQGNQTATTFDPGTLSNSTTYYWRIDEINGEGTTTGDVWNFTTTSGVSPPGAASSPSPANSVTDVNVTTDLSWTAGSGATSRDVYFGTTSPGASQGNQTATTFDTGTMDANTTYYWRIDEINAGGTTTGTVWNFTTTTESATTVGNTTIFGSSTTTANRRAAPYTMPADGTIQSVTMYHTGGSDDMILGVYTGSTDPNDRIAVTAQTAVNATTGWQTIDLTSSVFVESGTKIWLAWVYETNPGIYYEVGTPGRAHSDNTWSGGMPDPFGSSSQLDYIYSIYATYTPGGGTPPGQASNPTPANSAANVSINADLGWTEGNDSTSSDVYFGTTSPGAYQGNQEATTFDTGTMSNNTTYYWRIDEVNASGTTTGTVWSFTTIVAAPGQASSPSPSNSATGVSINADLSWTPGSGSTSSDVYFGTDSTPDSGELQGNQTATTFEPGTMSNNTTYYWRIDEINVGGTTTGAVWSFTTIVAAPGAASSPSPANSATDVSITADLSWTAGSGATSRDVYFGTTSPGTSQGNQTATTFDTGSMNNDTTYYWRIDEINTAGTTTGTVWSFTTVDEENYTVGNTTVFENSTTTANRRAAPYTMPADGIIESVTMYHTGGSDDMILGVYTGESLPGDRVAVTATTPVSGITGWQTIDLTSSVFVESGTKIWLAWVYESNPGIYYEVGTPGRAHSDNTWSGGMPDPFGSSSQLDYIYSIYANYTPTVTEEFGDAADTNYPGTIGDTYTNVGQGGDDNWSTDTTLNTYTWPADIIANTTIIKWDLTDIPTDAIVVEAILYLYQVDSDVDSSYDIGVHKITGVNPGITTCTWNTYDGTNSWTGGADGGQSDIAAAEDTQVVNLTDDEYKTWDVTEMVADWVAAPSTNYGMLVNSDDDATIDSYRYFASTDANDSSTRPKLIVTYSD
ncbi:MAG: DNRLRE domain-containing protein [Planctomycetota bacterium]|jgi:hypothetical protein